MQNLKLIQRYFSYKSRLHVVFYIIVSAGSSKSSGLTRVARDEGFSGLPASSGNI